MFAMTFLLVAGVFATSFAVADDNGTDFSTITPASVSDDISSSLSDLNQSSGYRMVSSSVITYGQGWITSSTNSTGYLFNALWVTQTLTNISSSDINSIRSQYQNDSRDRNQAIRGALANAVNTSFIKRTDGRINIDVGANRGAFKIVEDMGASTNASLVFNVYATNDKSNSNSLGTLSLSSTDYSAVSIWTGNLNLNSGNFAGTYSVSIASKSSGIVQPRVVGNPQNMPSDNRGNISGGGIVGSLNGSGAKVGFWQSLFNRLRGR